MTPFETSRIFDATRDNVWRAWTEAERLKQWFSPRGFKMVSCKLDLRPGGLFHYCLRMPEGGDVWGKWLIRQVAKPEKLVFIVSFSDADAGTTRHPMSPGWPLHIHSTILFEAQGNKTRVTVRWLPHEASAAELKAFEEGRVGHLKQGWSGTLDHLEAYLKQ